MDNDSLQDKVRLLSDTTNNILECQFGLTNFEAMQIAVNLMKVQALDTGLISIAELISDQLADNDVSLSNINDTLKGLITAIYEN